MIMLRRYMRLVRASGEVGCPLRIGAVILYHDLCDLGKYSVVNSPASHVLFIALMEWIPKRASRLKYYEATFLK